MPHVRQGADHHAGAGGHLRHLPVLRTRVPRRGTPLRTPAQIAQATPLSLRVPVLRLERGADRHRSRQLHGMGALRDISGALLAVVLDRPAHPRARDPLLRLSPTAEFLVWLINNSCSIPHTLSGVEPYVLLRQSTAGGTYEPGWRFGRKKEVGHGVSHITCPRPRSARRRRASVGTARFEGHQEAGS